MNCLWFHGNSKGLRIFKRDRRNGTKDSHVSLIYNKWVMSWEKVHADPSFGMTSKKIFRHILPWHGSNIACAFLLLLSAYGSFLSSFNCLSITCMSFPRLSFLLAGDWQYGLTFFFSIVFDHFPPFDGCDDSSSAIAKIEGVSLPSVNGTYIISWVGQNLDTTFTVADKISFFLLSNVVFFCSWCILCRIHIVRHSDVKPCGT